MNINDDAVSIHPLDVHAKQHLLYMWTTQTKRSRSQLLLHFLRVNVDSVCMQSKKNIGWVLSKFATNLFFTGSKFFFCVRLWIDLSSFLIFGTLQFFHIHKQLYYTLHERSMPPIPKKHWKLLHCNIMPFFNVEKADVEIFDLNSPSCALQLSMVLSRLSWKRLLICLLGEVREGWAPCCCCWTLSLSSFRSISALLRSERDHKALLWAHSNKLILDEFLLH